MVNFEFWCHKFIIARSAPAQRDFMACDDNSKCFHKTCTRGVGYFKLCSKIDTIYFNPISGGLLF